MGKMTGKVREIESGLVREITFTSDKNGDGYYLTPQQFHLIGHAPFATLEWVLVELNGEKLNPETGTYYNN